MTRRAGYVRTHRLADGETFGRDGAFHAPYRYSPSAMQSGLLFHRQAELRFAEKELL